MGHILDYDGKFINFLNKAADTLIATLLWLVPERQGRHRLPAAAELRL